MKDVCFIFNNALRICHTWLGKVLELVDPLLADVELEQAGAPLLLAEQVPHLLADGVVGGVVLAVEEDVGLGVLHDGGVHLGDCGVVEFVPLLVFAVNCVRCVVPAAGVAVMADDPCQVVRADLKQKKSQLIVFSENLNSKFSRTSETAFLWSHCDMSRSQRGKVTRLEILEKSWRNLFK